MQDNKQIELKHGIVYTSQEFRSWFVDATKVKVSSEIFTIAVIYILLSLPYILITIIK